MSFNMAVVLRESRNAHPDKPLCHIADETFTYAQVDEISGRIAASLRNLGVRRGDKVAVQLPNLPHFLFAYFGILKAGAVMVPLDPLLRAREISYRLRNSESRLLITFETSADEAVKGGAWIKGLSTYVVNLPGNDQRPVDTKSFDELYHGDDTGEIEPTNAEDTAVIIYISGARKPKRAELTHHQLYVNCTSNGERLRFRDDDMSMAVLPMFDFFGLSGVLNMAVRFGGTLVLVPTFDAQTVVDELAQHRCTIFSGVPTMYYALLEADTDGRDMSALRLGCSAGTNIPGEVIRAFEEKFPGAVIVEGYGLTLTASLTVQDRIALLISKLVSRVAAWVVGYNDTELPSGAGDVGLATRCFVFAVVFAMVADVTPWRTGTYFSGQLDWVVLAKLGILMVAVLVVLWARSRVVRGGRSITAGMASALLLVALYSGSSALGAFAFGSFVSSVELSVRVLAVGLVALVLIELVGPMTVISTLSRVLAAAAIFVSATGSMSTEYYPGRLVGGFPPVNPNEIAFLAAVPMIYFVWRTVNVDVSYLRIVVAVTLGSIILLTQSRTTAAVTAAVVLCLIIRGTRDFRLSLSIITTALIGIVFVLTFTNSIHDIVSRGGTQGGDSVGGRSIAWNAVLNMNRDPVENLFGQGLADKVISVEGQWWSAQVMDSSWFSAFIQAGLIGFALAVALVVYAVIQALRNARPVSDLWLALIVLVVIRSITESGLLDTSMGFFVFMLVSMGAATQAHLGSFQEGFTFTPGSRAIALPRTTPAYPGKPFNPIFTGSGLEQ
jgi:long-chain acyl-CoA synthetase